VFWGQMCALPESQPLVLADPVRWSGERLVTSQGVYGYVSLGKAGVWVALDELIEPALMGRMAADAESSCPTMYVSPFASPGVFVVTTERSIYVASPQTFGFRELDHVGGVLENCRVDLGRDQLQCALDLSFGEARFDAEGHTLSTSFEPIWQ
jgi:hypothetical protein